MGRRGVGPRLAECGDADWERPVNEVRKRRDTTKWRQRTSGGGRRTHRTRPIECYQASEVRTATEDPDGCAENGENAGNWLIDGDDHTHGRMMC